MSDPDALDTNVLKTDSVVGQIGQEFLAGVAVEEGIKFGLKKALTKQVATGAVDKSGKTIVKSVARKGVVKLAAKSGAKKAGSAIMSKQLTKRLIKVINKEIMKSIAKMVRNAVSKQLLKMGENY